MIQSFSLDEASTSTHVEIGSTSTRLDYVADLRSLQRTVLPESTPEITFDWSEIETNALGNPFLENNITEVVVARYSQSSAQLEQQFLDLESIHEGLWRGNVESGASLSLTELTDESGAPFPGFDSESTWVVALSCGGCSNPAPWYMTVVETCSDP